MFPSKKFFFFEKKNFFLKKKLLLLFNFPISNRGSGSLCVLNLIFGINKHLCVLQKYSNLDRSRFNSSQLQIKFSSSLRSRPSYGVRFVHHRTRVRKLAFMHTKVRNDCSTITKVLQTTT